MFSGGDHSEAEPRDPGAGGGQRAGAGDMVPRVQAELPQTGAGPVLRLQEGLLDVSTGDTDQFLLYKIGSSSVKQTSDV